MITLLRILAVRKVLSLELEIDSINEYWNNEIKFFGDEMEQSYIYQCDQLRIKIIKFKISLLRAFHTRKKNKGIIE